ncbi:MAG: transcription antitermination factor NusB [Puniceicoccales bacterium]|jgi:N utilization substance protein B|nr:transcription antitermination factor NusB [Puniceicoccales bacterium]
MENDIKISKEVVNRHDNRVFAMQLIYASEIAPEKSPEHLWEELLEMLHGSGNVNSYEFSRSLFMGTMAHREEIDNLLKSFLTNWKISRLARVDLAILRLAIFEMLHCDNIPAVVSIDEAIELSKQYSTADSRRIVNGILDQLKRQLSDGEKTNTN